MAKERDRAPRSRLAQRHKRCVGIQRVNVGSRGNGVCQAYEVSVGVAMASPQGSLVRMLQEADRFSLGEIYARWKELRTQAEGTHLPAEALRGRTITVTNMAMDAVDRFQAILNPPHGAIIAARRMRGSPWSSPNGLKVRPSLTIRLNVDHRALGFPAPAPFQAEVRPLLGNPYANGQNCRGGQQALLREVM